VDRLPEPAGEQIHVRELLITSVARTAARACAAAGDGVFANQLKPEAEDEAAPESARPVIGAQIQATSKSAAKRMREVIGRFPHQALTTGRPCQ
jgi:hypothetical protein